MKSPLRGKNGLSYALAPRDPPIIRTLAPPLNVTLYLKPEFARNGRPKRRGYQYALNIAPLLLPAGPDNPHKGAPEERANRLQSVPYFGIVENRAQLAQLLGCSRAWVTKVPGTISLIPAEQSPRIERNRCLPLCEAGAASYAAQMSNEVIMVLALTIERMFDILLIPPKGLPWVNGLLLYKLRASISRRIDRHCGRGQCLWW